MHRIDIYRSDITASSDVAYVTILPDANSSQVKKVMGENLINITFSDSRYIQFKINDWCTVFGERYKVNRLPTVVKLSKYRYQYTLVMEADGHDLAKYQYLFLDDENELRESHFSLMGNAETFLDLIISNANRVDSGWTKGIVIPSDYKNLTFSKENCYNALSRIAEEFNTEWAIVGKKIHLTKRTFDTGYTFRHGRGKGLYEITRKTMDNTELVTRLYAYGSDKNLPPEYDYKRLSFPGGYNDCLISELTTTYDDDGTNITMTLNWTPPPNPTVTAIQVEYREAGSTNAWAHNTVGYTSPQTIVIPSGNYEFRFRTIGTMCSGLGAVTPVITINAPIEEPVYTYPPYPYLERNVHLYGIIEHTEIFEDIYPRRTGQVTGVNTDEPREFTDTTLNDFDINNCLLPGIAPKITFNTGQLAGYTFELESYDDNEHRFMIQKNTDEKVLEVPSDQFRPSIGDKYVITDIAMPSQYVEAAEAELLARANALLLQVSEPQLSYMVSIDPVFIKKYNRLVSIGDLVWIIDDELEVQKKIRVTSVIRNIVNEYQLQVELSDVVSPGTISRILNAQSSTERDVMDINGQFINNGILNNKVAGTLTFLNMPTINDSFGFQPVYLNPDDGKLYRLE